LEELPPYRDIPEAGTAHEENNALATGIIVSTPVARHQ
jgi:hypothetical protein